MSFHNQTFIFNTMHRRASSMETELSFCYNQRDGALIWLVFVFRVFWLSVTWWVFVDSDCSGSVGSFIWLSWSRRTRTCFGLWGEFWFWLVSGTCEFNLDLTFVVSTQTWICLLGVLTCTSFWLMSLRFRLLVRTRPVWTCWCEHRRDLFPRVFGLLTCLF